MSDGTIKTNKQLVLEAVRELHDQEQIVTRETLADFLDMKLSIIDDRLKALVADELIARVQRGVFRPIAQHPPMRVISHTETPDGMVTLDIGDQVIKLYPKEARRLGVMLSGRAYQASQIELGQAAAFANSELSARIRLLERQMELMIKQMELATAAG